MKTRNLFFIAFLGVSTLAQAQVKLSFNPEKGEKYIYLFQTEQSINQTVMGQEIPVNTVTDMLFEMDVKENNEDGISLSCAYNAIKMSVSNPMMNIRYDSQQPDENLTEIEKMIASIFTGLIGKSFNVGFEPNGSDGSCFYFCFQTGR